MTMEVNIPNEVSVEASVNDPTTRIFRLDGRWADVPVAHLQQWLAEGWTTFRYDVTSEASGLPLLFRVTEESWKAYVDGVVSDGFIDTEDTALQAVAHKALTDLCEAVGRVESAITGRYPVRQTPAVAMRTPNGDIVMIDNSQTDLYSQGPYNYQVVDAEG